MVEITMQLPEKLAARIGASGAWFPTIIELGLSSFRTRAALTAAELQSFLEANPLPEDVLAFRASPRSQLRLEKLLALNKTNLLSEKEELELDELEKIEHAVVMLKAQAAKQKRRNQS